MPTTRENENQQIQPEEPSPSSASGRREVPPPGRSLSFEEALKLTLREDKELLRRLAK